MAFWYGPQSSQNCGCCSRPPCTVWEENFDGDDGDPPDTDFWTVSDSSVEIHRPLVGQSAEISACLCHQSGALNKSAIRVNFFA